MSYLAVNMFSESPFPVNELNLQRSSIRRAKEVTLDGSCRSKDQRERPRVLNLRFMFGYAPSRRQADSEGLLRPRYTALKLLVTTAQPPRMAIDSPPHLPKKRKGATQWPLANRWPVRLERWLHASNQHYDCGGKRAYRVRLNSANRQWGKDLPKEVVG